MPGRDLDGVASVGGGDDLVAVGVRIRRVTSRMAASSSTTSTVSPEPRWTDCGDTVASAAGLVVAGSITVKVVPIPGSE